MLQDSRVHRKLGGPHHKLRLKHERQSVIEILRFQFGVSGSLEGFSIGTVPCHAIVKAGAARHKTFCLRVVSSEDKTHEFIHQVAMKPWWPECMFGHHPSRREDGKVAVSGPVNRRWRTEHGIDRLRTLRELARSYQTISQD